MALRKFECLDCHHRFDADEQTEVRCPHCQSDNVEPARFHIPKGVWKWCAGGMLLAGMAFVLVSVDWHGDETVAPMPDEPDTTTIAKTDMPDIPVPDIPGVKQTPVLKPGKPTYDGKEYTLSVTVKNVPDGIPYRMVLLQHRGDKVVAQADDGKFEHVPASDDVDGQYDLVLLAAGKDSALCSVLPVAGFVPVKQLSKKMSKEELQALIDKQDDSLLGAGGNDYIAPDCKISCADLPAGAFMADVLNKVEMGIWEAARVTSVGYDSHNRINLVEIKAVKAE